MTSNTPAHRMVHIFVQPNGCGTYSLSRVKRASESCETFPRRLWYKLAFGAKTVDETISNVLEKLNLLY